MDLTTPMGPVVCSICGIRHDWQMKCPHAEYVERHQAHESRLSRIEARFDGYMKALISGTGVLDEAFILEAWRLADRAETFLEGKREGK